MQTAIHPKERQKSPKAAKNRNKSDPVPTTGRIFHNFGPMESLFVQQDEVAHRILSHIQRHDPK